MKLLVNAIAALFLAVVLSGGAMASEFEGHNEYDGKKSPLNKVHNSDHEDEEHEGHDDHKRQGTHPEDCPIEHTKPQPANNDVVLCRECGSSEDLTELFELLSLYRVPVKAAEVR